MNIYEAHWLDQNFCTQNSVGKWRARYSEFWCWECLLFVPWVLSMEPKLVKGELGEEVNIFSLVEFKWYAYVMIENTFINYTFKSWICNLNTLIARHILHTKNMHIVIIGIQCPKIYQLLSENNFYLIYKQIHKVEYYCNFVFIV